MGRKVKAVLEFINKDINTSVLETLNTRSWGRLRWIRRRMDKGCYVAGGVLLVITGMMGNFHHRIGHLAGAFHTLSGA